MYSARCYCGAARLSFARPPLTVAYCHCNDCRRWTGAPVASFAAFAADDVAGREAFHPNPPKTPGVQRFNCQNCGSPLMATFDYLPGQVYVPLGICDQAAEFEPQIHCHSDKALPWLHINDGLPRKDGSARETLTSENR